MVLSFMGRRSMDPTTVESIHQWELLAQALMNMVSEVHVVMSSRVPYNTNRCAVLIGS
jgi:hypothetical protein